MDIVHRPSQHNVKCAQHFARDTEQNLVIGMAELCSSGLRAG
jgi:hypothetical protein